jgi:predicted regulator of Ras-like GTPase activity (Roadblock/LC7/MglB family)
MEELANRSPILGVAIFSIEGHAVVSHFHSGTEEILVAALIAGIQSASEQTVKELKQGELKSIIVEGELGTTVVISMPNQYLLTLTAPENVKLGLVFNDGKQFARKASRLLQGLTK